MPTASGHRGTRGRRSSWCSSPSGRSRRAGRHASRRSGRRCTSRTRRSASPCSDRRPVPCWRCRSPAASSGAWRRAGSCPSPRPPRRPAPARHLGGRPLAAVRLARRVGGARGRGRRRDEHRGGHCPGPAGTPGVVGAPCQLQRRRSRRCADGCGVRVARGVGAGPARHRQRGCAGGCAGGGHRRGRRGAGARGGPPRQSDTAFGGCCDAGVTAPAAAAGRRHLEGGAQRAGRAGRCRTAAAVRVQEGSTRRRQQRRGPGRRPSPGAPAGGAGPRARGGGPAPRSWRGHPGLAARPSPAGRRLTPDPGRHKFSE